MSDLCAVLIGASALLPGLVERAGALAGEVLTFADADALGALEAITQRRPALVVLERVFAVTPRGAALINRIKADPALRQSEIRVVAHDNDYVRVVPRSPPPTAPALDQRGTRRARRFKMTPNLPAQIESKTAMLVDLSIVGAQVVSPGALRPNQRINIGLIDGGGTVRFTAQVVWTSFEIPLNGGPRYRAGLDFGDDIAEAEKIAAYCQRHKV